MHDKQQYPLIEDYAFIADCHSTALISRSGSIDWCCMPRIDWGSCFARLLGWEEGGFCQIAPTDSYESSRRYLRDTLVLETTFRTKNGEVRLTDCFSMRRGGQRTPFNQILRVLEGVEGRVDLALDLVPRFDYGAVKPWIRKAADRQFVAIGGNDGLVISGDFPFEMKHRHDIIGACTVGKGEKVYLSIEYRRPEDLDDGTVDVPSIEELERRLRNTIDWWRSWAAQGRISGPYEEYIRRSALVLKGLSHAPTGAIAAAPTTSLPEAMGGGRNWDYRFSWIRDSSFTVRSLAVVGYVKEADGFRRFIERSAAGSAVELQILFGVGGERRLHELEIEELGGYRGSKPVRAGNAAESQKQLDVYGELLDLAWHWHERGHSPDDDYWDFLVELVNEAATQWRDPDRGIWEVRGEPRHFVHSKVLCWAALDLGIRLAEDLSRKAPLDRWKKSREELRQAVEDKGYDPGRGVFIQAFDRPKMDGALLLLPGVGFIDYKDERMIRTTNAIMEDLSEDGLLRRYPVGEDGLEGEEGAFLACSFWLAECLARQGRLDEAHRVFQRALDTGNDLYLFSEEFNTRTGEMLGNFPQGLTHLSLITASVALAEMEKREGKAS